MGGIDLVFPHHENEIAQSECATGQPLARYWIHNGLLEINSEKMSKSLGNIIRTHEFIAKYGADLFRLLVLSFHYRSPIDFSDENIQRTDLLLHKLNKAYLEVLSSHEETLPVDLPPELSQLTTKIDEALFDDFHTAKAFGLMMSGLRVCFREDRPAYWRAWGACLPILQDVFGILKQNPVEALDDLRIRKLKRSGMSEEKAQMIESRLSKRLELRKQKQFAEADLIREELLREGVLVMDTSEGSTWMLKD
jgi:cysteinyl-tRNA synthetase